MSTKGSNGSTGTWLTYRPEIKVLDCTIRDGGLMNNHRFSDEIVAAVFSACSAGGIDYMEVGYKASKRLFYPTKFGKWKFCDAEDIRRIVGDNDTSLKLTAMCDAEKTDYHEDVLPKEQSVLDMIRVATYVKDLDMAVKMARNATDKGYECSINIMAISHEGPPRLEEALQQFEEETKAKAVYIVDSFGALYRATVHYLVENYRSTRYIIEAANRLIAGNADRMKTEHPIRIDRHREMLPAGGATEAQEQQLTKMGACINSMTPQERRHPQILNASRKRRVAKGSGTSVEEINRLLRQYGQMRKLMKRLGKVDARTLKRQLGIH